MTPERPQDRIVGDREVEQAWRAQSTDEPGAAVDAAIRAAARRELRRRPTWQRYAPLAAAASVGVLAFLLLRQNSPIEVPRGESPPARTAPAEPTASEAAPAEPAAPQAPAAPPEPRRPREQEAPARQEAKPAAPPPAVAREAAEAPASTERSARSDAADTVARVAAVNSASTVTPPRALIARVKEDAARRASVRASDVRVLSVEAVTWPDRGLGCEETDAAVTDQPVPGFRIEVDAGGERMQYHTDDSDSVCIRNRP